MLLKKLKFQRKHRRIHNIVHDSDEFDISTEDEENYLDLSSSTLSCLNYLEYAEETMYDRVKLVNRSKSFHETGVATPPPQRRQRDCRQNCDITRNSSNKTRDCGVNRWTFLEYSSNDKNNGCCCGPAQCHLIKKKHFYDRFFNQIRNISQGYRRIIHTNGIDERGEFLFSFVY